ncbi:MAG TPA: chemotaxis protein CheW [Vicinamibacterales bacterium]|nr:chemotaxis protein CheW [Vicinamibacterales bacterium]
MTGDAFVCCGVGEEQYALRAMDVRQIVRSERIREAASADGRVGVLEFAGAIVPVFPLGRALGRPAARVSTASGGHVVVTGGDRDLIGWLVDGIERTPIGDDCVIAPLPPIVGPRAARWFSAIVRDRDRSMLLLAPRGAQPANRPRVRVGAAVPGPADRCVPAVIVFGSPALPPADVARFALSCRRVVAVAQDLSLTIVPGSARHVAGLAWWRDAVMPVIDFRGAIASDAGGRRRCLVARGSERWGAAYVALPVDADLVMHRPSAEDRVSVDVACPRFASGVFDVGGTHRMALLDLDALLTGESAAIEEVA